VCVCDCLCVCVCVLVCVCVYEREKERENDRARALEQRESANLVSCVGMYHYSGLHSSQLAVLCAVSLGRSCGHVLVVCISERVGQRERERARARTRTHKRDIGVT